jgi:glycosyltransferase involved in cell wall biosynthesis
MAKRIIIAVTNDLETDQRVGRMADTLTDEGYEVLLVGRLLKNSLHLQRKYHTKRFKLWFNKGPLFYANYNLRLFFFLLFTPFDAVLSNDLDTLLACFTASKLKRRHLVYDSHEYFTEVPELVGRNFQKKAWLTIEKMMVPKIKYAFTVSSSIAAEYEQKYGTHFLVVRNLPVYKEPLLTQKQNAIIYQGALNLGRGIELMIDAMRFLPDMELWIAGNGDISASLKKRVQTLNLLDRIKFLGKVPYQELHSITSQAKIGLSLEENLGKNYYFALPNKLFDYIQARIPVLVSDLPEMKKIVEAEDIGEVIVERKPKVLAEQIKRILLDLGQNNRRQIKLEDAARRLCWENEKEIVINLFSTLLRS